MSHPLAGFSVPAAFARTTLPIQMHRHLPVLIPIPRQTMRHATFNTWGLVASATHRHTTQ